MCARSTASWESPRAARRPGTRWNTTCCEPPLNSDGYPSSLLLPPPREKPSVLTAYFQPPYARLVSRRAEFEPGESGEQAIMEERMGDAFAGSEHLTVIGRRLYPGGTAPDYCLNYLDLVDMAVHTVR